MLLLLHSFTKEYSVILAVPLYPFMFSIFFCLFLETPWCLRVMSGGCICQLKKTRYKGISDNCRITKWLNLSGWGWKELWRPCCPPPAPAAKPWAGSPGPHSNSLWISPRMEILQPLWAPVPVTSHREKA